MQHEQKHTPNLIKSRNESPSPAYQGSSCAKKYAKKKSVNKFISANDMYSFVFFCIENRIKNSRNAQNKPPSNGM